MDAVANKPFACNVCEKSFKYELILTEHKKIHTGQLKKNNTFCQNVDLAKQNKIHTGDTPFSCDVCKKIFPFYSSLKRHKRIHTGEKPYACDICVKAFTNKSHLDEHKRIHAGVKPYECVVCNKTFTQSSALTFHERIHKSDQNIFSDQNSLVQHNIIHTGEIPIQCDEDKKIFSNNISSINCHRRTHTGEKLFACVICQKSFSKNSVLTRHKRTASHLKMEKSQITTPTSTSLVNCDETIKIEEIKGEINGEEESVDDPLSIQEETNEFEIDNNVIEVKGEVIYGDSLCGQEIHNSEYGD